VYLTAFENGATPSNVYEDKKIAIGSWLPDNYEGRYFGSVTLENAFANSLNSISIQLAKQFGGKAIAATARKLGVTSKIEIDDPTIALGTTEISLLELTAAYAAIANQGTPVVPYTISEINDNNDEVLYKRQSSGFDAIISTQNVENMKRILHQVVVSGTGKNANVGENIYGKTGTSQNFRDAWFIGFNNDYVVGVWIGNDDNSATNKITGGSLPALLFGKIISAI
jgi:penicillin-binding protein 1A